MEVTVFLGNDDAGHAVCGQSRICADSGSGRISGDEECYRSRRYPVLPTVYKKLYTADPADSSGHEYAAVIGSCI